MAGSPIGLADGAWVEREVELGLGLHGDGGAGGFRSSGGDPGLQGFEVGVGNLRAIGGHGRLFLVGDDEVEAAIIGVAGLDDGARAAAGHGAAKGVERQAAFLLVVVMAGVALGLEDRQDVVLVVDLGAASSSEKAAVLRGARPGRSAQESCTGLRTGEVA